MSIEALKTKIPDYAKDIKLNLSTLLGGVESVKFDATQIAGLALAAAYATRQTTVIQLIREFAQQQGLPESHVEAAKAAASIMAMTNIYYRSVHWIQKDYATLAPNLRMQILQKHGITQQEFELYSVVISAINGCERCLSAHINVLEKGGMGTVEIQYSLRLAAVIQAFAQVMVIEAASI